MKKLTITIDGARGAGKSRTAEALYCFLAGTGASVSINDGGKYFDPSDLNFPDLTGVDITINVEQK